MESQSVQAVSIQQTPNNESVATNDNKPKLSKEERVEKERELLLSKLAANKLIELRPRVAFILNHYPETRNSDVLLSFKYWEVFEPEIIPTNGVIDQRTMLKLERQTSITRARAKIQNEYGLFRAEERVRHRRMSLENREKEEQLADKPGIPSVIFYLDESGKNQKYVIVGGISCVNGFRQYKMATDVINWKAKNRISYEFHFTELSRGKLDSYKQFFDLALGYSDSISFKAVAVQREGITDRNIEQIICDLHYQVIHKGMEFDITQGRITLPREVYVYKDKDDGSDKIYMAKLEEELKSGFSRHFRDNLKLQELDAPDSKGNPFIQLADLFIGSVARVLNKQEQTTNNQKDELATYILNTLGLNLEHEESSSQDIAFVNIL